jgi:hypothetical protein
VGTQVQGSLFPFLIRDLTPREKRAFPSGKPGNPDFVGVTKVRIAASGNPFEKAYGPLGNTPVVLVHRPANREAVVAFGIPKVGSSEVIWIESPAHN